MSSLIICVLASALRQEKNKRLSVWKGKSKTVERQDHLCRKSDGSSKKLLELISGFNKVAGYKINIQKSKYF